MATDSVIAARALLGHDVLRSTPIQSKVYRPRVALIIMFLTCL
jgi:hypothetical protein